MPKFSISSIKKEDIEGVIASGALITSAILPHGEIDGLNLCPHYYLTGQECPFCGMTRGFVAITHLDLKSALDFNLGTPLIYLAFIYVSLRSLVSIISDIKEFKIPKPIYNLWLFSTITVFAIMAWNRVIIHLF
jgi:hypothetical protein|tara:strand:- start:122 stop:523 length:402 start_codon:yes stop_codon:yes gene_type:complete